MKRCLNCLHIFYEKDGWTCGRCGWRPAEVEGFPSFTRDTPDRRYSYPREAYASLYQLECGSFWFRNRNRLIIKMLADYFPEASSLLEIGCGTGFVLAGIAASNPGLNLTGSDAHLEALSHAKTRLPVCTLLQMDAADIPYYEEFDVIGAFDVLEHIPADQEILRQMHRALKPGGGLMITVPQHPWLWSRADENAGHLRRYTRQALMTDLTDRGFRIIRITSFLTLLMPLMILSRRWSRLRSGSTSTNPQWTELRLPRPIDRLFETLCSWENMGISRGLSFPSGGSLLCLATRG